MDCIDECYRSNWVWGSLTASGIYSRMHTVYIYKVATRTLSQVGQGKGLQLLEHRFKSYRVLQVYADEYKWFLGNQVSEILTRRLLFFEFNLT